MAEGGELDPDGGYPQKELYIDTMEMSNKLRSESSILIDLVARFFFAPVRFDIGTFICYTVNTRFILCACKTDFR